MTILDQAPRRSVILVDVDGVCADLLTPLFARIRSDKSPSDIVFFDIFAQLSSRDALAARQVMTDPDLWATLPIIEGAQAGVARLREHGHVVFVTSPYESCRGWESVRRDWLIEHFGAGPHDIVFAGDKTHVHGSMIIDDKSSTVAAYAARWRTAECVVFDATYNRVDHPAGCWRLSGWKGLGRLLDEIYSGEDCA